MPTWSPDGSRIAFSCVVESPNRDICAINADGTEFVRLTSAPENEYLAAWSPSGSPHRLYGPVRGTLLGLL
jgi:Tol biopolymer transport system component